MLIFASDLHLADDPRLSSFDCEPFARAVDTCLRARASDENVTLVLLGDVFELLKSHVWMESEVRPWSPPGMELNEVTGRIFDGIVENNPAFFHILDRLHTQSGVSIRFLPGNHDGLLGDPAVSGLRHRLRKAISALPDADDEPLPGNLLDIEHGVVADHGHGLDWLNSRADDDSRFIVGDAVVIEFLVRLPGLVANALAVHAKGGERDEAHRHADFVHEIDNVVPQSLEVMINWLEKALDKLARDHGQGIAGAIVSSIDTCLDFLLRTVAENMASNRVALAFVRLMANYRRLKQFRGFLRESGDNALVVDHIKAIVALQGAGVDGIDGVDTYVAGHTHATMQDEFAIGDRRITYLNTGTWRRVTTPSWSFRDNAYHAYFKGTLLCVRRLADRSLKGRYEFFHYIRGA